MTLAFPCASAFMMYALERFGRKPTAVTAFVLTGVFGLLWANASSQAMVLAIGFCMIFAAAVLVGLTELAAQFRRGQGRELRGRPG
jgi:MFS family permease